MRVGIVMPMADLALLHLLGGKAVAAQQTYSIAFLDRAPWRDQAAGLGYGNTVTPAGRLRSSSKSLAVGPRIDPCWTVDRD
jgi:hypothetical protein